MIDELKPCPFCGGEARAFRCEESGTFDVQCQRCGAIPFIGSRTSEKKTMADVIAAWNARAERTCENLLDDHSCDFECSACGFSVSTVPDEGTDWLTTFWSYCPNCGAKVVG